MAEWPEDTVLAITVPRLDGWEIFDLRIALTLSRGWVYYRETKWQNISEKGVRKIVNVATNSKVKALLDVVEDD